MAVERSIPVKNSWPNFKFQKVADEATVPACGLYKGLRKGKPTICDG
jgi:hypothetical protein